MTQIDDNRGVRKEIEMRSRKLFMSVITVAGMALVAAPGIAQGQAPYSCSAGDWTVTTYGGGSVSCNPADWNGPNGFYGSGTECTGIEYEISSSSGDKASLAYTLIRDVGLVDSDFVGGYVNTAYPACDGDGKLAVDMCHEQLLRVTPDSNVNNSFRIALPGNYVTTWTSVIFKKGSRYESCRIPGLGSDSSLFSGTCVPSCGNFDPNQTVLKTEIYDIKGCKAQFDFDTNTGAVVDFFLLPNQDPLCKTIDAPVTDVSVKIGDDDLGNGKFGDGFFTIGGNTCSCRVIGGRIYCWGAPCPDYN